MTARPVALLLVPLLALASCSDSGQQGRGIRPGSYAGSTAADRAVRVDVGGGVVRLDGRELRRGPRGTFVDPDRGVTLECEPAPRQAGADDDGDIVCEITRSGVTEKVELMRL